MRPDTKKWIDTAAAALLITIAAVAETVPIGGGTAAELFSQKLPLLGPVPVTFLFRAVIGLFLLAFLLYRWKIVGLGSASESFGLWFAASCLIDILWIFFWHYGALRLSFLMSLALFLSLLLMRRKLREAPDTFGRDVLRVGLDLVYGWSAAVTAGCLLAATGMEDGIPGFSGVFADALVLLAGSVLTGALVLLKKRSLPSLSVIWVYGGVLGRHLSEDTPSKSYPALIASAVIGIAVMLSAVLFNEIRASFEAETE